jgi:hypothetical protein
MFPQRTRPPERGRMYLVLTGIAESSIGPSDIVLDITQLLGIARKNISQCKSPIFMDDIRDLRWSVRSGSCPGANTFAARADRLRARATA